MKLLAPNGKQSNLNEEQWHLVRTPEFKRWFGDWEKLAYAKLKDAAMDDVTLERLSKNVSKVVDENGEPLVVWHGSKSFDINEFDLSQSKRKSSGLKEFGTYFTDNTNLAKAYRNWGELKEDEERSIDFQIYKWEKILDESRNNRDYKNAQEQIERLEESKKGKIYGVFLNLKKIHVFDAKGDVNIEAWNNLEVKASYKWAKNRDAMEFLKEGKFGVEKVDGIKAENIVDAFVQTEELKKELLSNVYLVFDSKNIKLADGTNTTFDGNNNDIRFEGGGIVNFVSSKSLTIKIGGDLYKVQYRRGELGDTDKNVWFADVVSKNGERIEDGRLCYDDSYGNVIYGFSLYEVEKDIIDTFKKNDLHLIIQDDYGVDIEVRHIEFSINPDIRFKNGGNINFTYEIGGL